jgi:hypothetical protein
MPSFDLTLPAPLAEANALQYDYCGGTGFDFEPFAKFESADENARWIRAWTRNGALDGAEYRFFGMDGTGGLAGLWLVREGRPLVDQPVVFFGSEGEVGVVARNLPEYLWVLAGGFGPLEAISYIEEDRTSNGAFSALATKYAPEARKSAREAVRLAAEEFPDFEARVRSFCK